MDLLQAFITTVCGIIMIIGLVGVMIPSFPGIILMWSSFTLFAATTQFEIVGFENVVTVTLLTFAIFILEYVSRFWGAHKFNAGKLAFAGAIIGGIAGSVFDWTPALLVGSFIGAVLGRVYSGYDKPYKIRFKLYTLIGFVGETIVKLCVGVIIFGMYIYRLSDFYY